MEGMDSLARTHRVRDATVGIGTVLPIPTVLAELGAVPAQVITEAGVDPALFNDPDNLISYAARARLLNHCAAKTRCQHFGLLIGQRGGLQSLGIIGLLARYSTDVDTALRSLVTYMHLHVRGASVSLRTEGGVAVFAYGITEPNVEAADQIGDGAVAMIFNTMRTLCGPEWEPIEVRFARRRPGDIMPYRLLFRTALCFDAPENAVVFARQWLGHHLPNLDLELQRHLRQQIDLLQARYTSDFLERVRGVMRAGLHTGHSSAEQVAAVFDIHPRTLHRRLRVLGTNFRKLSDGCRFAAAQQMLENTSLEVTEIAAALGYVDTSAFTRAFRRWSGTTPGHWRAAH